MMRTLLITAALLACAGCAIDSNRVRVPFHASLPMQTAGTLHVSQTAGETRVIAWKEPRVQVDAEKIGSDAETANGIRIRLEKTADGVNVHADGPDHAGFGKQANVYFVIHAPAGASLDLSGTAGDITASGFTSDVRADVVAGQITIVMARMQSPQIVWAHAVTGQVVVQLPKNGAATVKTSALVGEKDNTFTSAPGVNPGTVTASAMVGQAQVESAVR